MKSSDNGNIMNEDFKFKIFARELKLLIRNSGRTNFILKRDIEDLLRDNHID